MHGWACTGPGLCPTLDPMSDQTSDQAGPNGQAGPGVQAETRRRVPVREAARLLETTVEGVRSRIKRGSLDSMRVEGTVYVLLSSDQIDQARPGAQSQPDPSGRPADALVEELRDRVRSLESQLSEERTANRENRRIIAGLVQRVPELEAAKEPPPEPREGDLGASEGENGSHVSPESERRSWWQRFFGLD
jgi:hypothetical protein